MQKNVLSIKVKILHQKYVAQENAKKIKTVKKSNLNSFASMCGVDLDNSGKTGSTSIKDELNEYLSYVTKFPDLSLSEFWRRN
jgi:hypothetical protein